MRSVAEYVVQLREQLDAVKRRVDVFRHRDFAQDQLKTLLRFLKRDYELGLASLMVAEGGSFRRVVVEPFPEPVADRMARS